MDIDYEKWVRDEAKNRVSRGQAEENIKQFSVKPIFSVILPVYNVEEKWLRKCIDSVREQYYPYWELCIADDASTVPHVKTVLNEYSAIDSRIKVVYRNENGHISLATNSALQLATGDYIAFLDHDDELSVDALYENAVLINKYENVGMIYSDEDKIDINGKRSFPFFKPDWSPDTFLSNMYTCHLGVYKTKLVRESGGIREGFEGSQDYDFVLRFTERTTNIYHIPKILYHWRMLPNSTSINPNSKKYAFEAGRKAIQEALERRGEGGHVIQSPFYLGQYRVVYPCSENRLISIIIYKEEMLKNLGVYLDIIFKNTDYPNLEVILVDSNKILLELSDVVDFWIKKEPARLRIIQLNRELNGSEFKKMINECAELLVFLEKSFKLNHQDWLKDMAGFCLRKSIGAVFFKSFHPHYSFFPEMVSNTVKEDIDGVMVEKSTFLSLDINKKNVWHSIHNDLKTNEKERYCVFIPI
ncbi:glycosyltransferase [Metabacillus herbersteinensis]|uniref:Glycosyltransferase n=1 Tax=Metabacillus herbersteinensis TaxID=283816 RepID=A0ABV6GG64_9BACI